MKKFKNYFVHGNLTTSSLKIEWVYLRVKNPILKWSEISSEQIV